MITLAREQAEFVLAVLRARIRQIDSLPQYQVIDSAAEQYRSIASEIERQLITEAAFSPLERFDSCTCHHPLREKDCPKHGHEWRKAEEYPPQKQPLSLKDLLLGLGGEVESKSISFTPDEIVKEAVKIYRDESPPITPPEAA